MRPVAASLRTLVWTVAGLAAVVGAAPARSEPAGAVVVAAAGPDWPSLTPAQQDALAPLRRDWAEIDPARRQMWISFILLNFILTYICLVIDLVFNHVFI
ncbi:MAG: DUF3106 domain-containing protein [Burkholderiales bacterium]|nr:DUF3106 domain-containing protein [Burkholderiales bacterium]